MKKHNKKGFTLVELLVVIVIIGILAAVIIPNVANNIEKANKSAAEQEAKAKYNEVLSALDLENGDKAPENFFYFGDKYVVYLKNGSLQADKTKKIDEVTVPITFADSKDVATALGVTLQEGDFVVKLDGNGYKFAQYNGSSSAWEQCDLVNGKFEIEKANKSAAEQEAKAKYNEVLSALDLENGDKAPENFFYFGDKYVVYLKNGSLQADKTKKIDEVTVAEPITLTAAEANTAFGVALKEGDVVVKLVGNGYKFAKYEKDSVSGNLTWVQYQLNNGEFKKAQTTPSGGSETPNP